RCTTRASILERGSAFISLYFLLVGIIASISAITNIICEGWPYIPLILSWSIPALVWKIFKGTIVVKNPNVEFKRKKIYVDSGNNDDNNDEVKEVRIDNNNDNVKDKDNGNSNNDDKDNNNINKDE